MEGDHKINKLVMMVEGVEMTYEVGCIYSFQMVSKLSETSLPILYKPPIFLDTQTELLFSKRCEQHIDCISVEDTTLRITKPLKMEDDNFHFGYISGINKLSMTIVTAHSIKYVPLGTILFHCYLPRSTKDLITFLPALKKYGSNDYKFIMEHNPDIYQQGVYTVDCTDDDFKLYIDNYVAKNGFPPIENWYKYTIPMYCHILSQDEFKLLSATAKIEHSKLLLSLHIKK